MSDEHSEQDLKRLASDLSADDPALLTDVPYEALPTLATNERAQIVFQRLREMKEMKDAYFEERVDTSGKKIPSLWDELKLEAGAFVAASGVKSVTFIDLRIGNAEGGVTKGKVTGSGIMDAASGVLTLDQYRGIALSAKDCDPDVLARNGIPAHLIAAGRDKDKPRAASTRVEWIGAKGKGAGRKKGGAGGSVQ